MFFADCLSFAFTSSPLSTSTLFILYQSLLLATEITKQKSVLMTAEKKLHFSLFNYVVGNDITYDCVQNPSN